MSPVYHIFSTQGKGKLVRQLSDKVDSREHDEWH